MFLSLSLHFATFAVQYFGTAIACFISSLSVSFDPLNQTNDSFVEKLVKNVTCKEVKEKKELFPVFYSFLARGDSLLFFHALISYCCDTEDPCINNEECTVNLIFLKRERYSLHIYLFTSCIYTYM